MDFFFFLEQSTSDTIISTKNSPTPAVIPSTRGRWTSELPLRVAASESPDCGDGSDFDWLPPSRDDRSPDEEETDGGDKPPPPLDSGDDFSEEDPPDAVGFLEDADEEDSDGVLLEPSALGGGALFGVSLASASASPSSGGEKSDVDPSGNGEASGASDDKSAGAGASREGGELLLLLSSSSAGAVAGDEAISQVTSTAATFPLPPCDRRSTATATCTSIHNEQH